MVYSVQLYSILCIVFSERSCMLLSGRACWVLSGWGSRARHMVGSGSRRVVEMPWAPTGCAHPFIPSGVLLHFLLRASWPLPTTIALFHFLLTCSTRTMSHYSSQSLIHPEANMPYCTSYQELACPAKNYALLHFLLRWPPSCPMRPLLRKYSGCPKEIYLPLPHLLSTYYK